MVNNCNKFLDELYKYDSFAYREALVKEWLGGEDGADEMAEVIYGTLLTYFDGLYRDRGPKIQAIHTYFRELLGDKVWHCNGSKNDRAADPASESENSRLRNMVDSQRAEIAWLKEQIKLQDAQIGRNIKQLSALLEIYEKLRNSKE